MRNRRRAGSLPSSDSAVNAACRYLAVRDHSREELRKKLADKGFPPEEIRRTLDLLEAKDYLRDERFALLFARGQVRLKAVGPDRLRMSLEAKGITREVIRRTLETLASETPEEETAREALRKKAGDSPSGFSLAERRRLTAYLRRKGFGYDTINRVLTLMNS
ncbi:MAG: regulatory protein RecX [Nitrospirae bacterium]|nr:regulatory protein RecX [Nitrospirota bacterium]